LQELNFAVLSKNCKIHKIFFPLKFLPLRYYLIELIKLIKYFYLLVESFYSYKTLQLDMFFDY